MTDFLLQLASLLLGGFGGLVLAFAPIIVWVAGKDAEHDDRAPGFRATMLIFWGMMAAGGLMGFAAIFIASQIRWPA